MVDGRKWGIVFGIRWDGGRRPRSVAFAALAALTVALVPSTAQAHRADAGDHAAARTLLILPAAGRGADARALVERLGGRAGRRLAIAHGFVARVPADRLATLRRSAAVRSAAPDVALHVDGAAKAADKDDLRAAASADLVRSVTGAQDALDRGVDGSGVAIALVDTGVQSLPGLDRARIVRSPDFSSDAADRDLENGDAFGHGTHLAGVMVGQDAASGFTGVAPGATLVSVKVADSDGTTSLLRVLAGLDWVRRHKDDRGAPIRVVNLSLGVDAGAESYVREPMAFAAETLWRAGIVVVAAAGNNASADAQLDMPAADPFVVAVGALDTHDTVDPADDRVADFSSRSHRRGPDVLAPGTGIISLRVPGSELDRDFPAARVGSRWFRGAGTSQATAVVSGLSALLLSARPDLDPDQLKALLERGAHAVAVPGGPGEVAAAAGSGSVDLDRSLALPAPRTEQRFPAAVLDLFGPGGRDMGPGSAEWAGRRWSGRRWSGFKWAGRRWSGAAWVADKDDQD
jgi:serine protease AprX